MYINLFFNNSRKITFVQVYTFFRQGKVRGEAAGHDPLGNKERWTSQLTIEVAKRADHTKTNCTSYHAGVIAVRSVLFTSFQTITE